MSGDYVVPAMGYKRVPKLAYFKKLNLLHPNAAPLAGWVCNKAQYESEHCVFIESLRGYDVVTSLDQQSPKFRKSTQKEYGLFREQVEGGEAFNNSNWYYYVVEIADSSSSSTTNMMDVNIVMPTLEPRSTNMPLFGAEMLEIFRQEAQRHLTANRNLSNTSVQQTIQQFITEQEQALRLSSSSGTATTTNSGSNSNSREQSSSSGSYASTNSSSAVLNSVFPSLSLGNNNNNNNQQHQRPSALDRFIMID